jgi:hypothetical protein
MIESHHIWIKEEQTLQVNVFIIIFKVLPNLKEGSVGVWLIHEKTNHTNSNAYGR